MTLWKWMIIIIIENVYDKSKLKLKQIKLFDPTIQINK